MRRSRLLRRNSISRSDKNPSHCEAMGRLYCSHRLTRGGSVRLYPGSGSQTCPQTRGQVCEPDPNAYIFPVNMMCAFGVPGNMIHGDVSLGFDEMPVVSLVAPGMYVT